MISFLFIFLLLVFIVGMGWATIYLQNHSAAKNTVKSDKRMEVQYKLRTEKNTASNLAVIFASALFVTILVFALGKPYHVVHKTNQREIIRDTIPIEDENSIIK